MTSTNASTQTPCNRQRTSYYWMHRTEILERGKTRRLMHINEIKERNKLYRQKNKTKIREHDKIYRQEHREMILEHDKLYRTTHKVERRAKVNTQRDKLRLEILCHYSRGTMTCAWCGFSDVRALCLDHVNGGGGEHRDAERGNFYLWAIKNGFPDGYQVLCANCNLIKAREQHEFERSKI